MFVKAFGWRGLAMGLVLGFGLFALGSNAIAQEYVGDQMCKVCHSGKYAQYKQHGHPWQEIPTDGQEPGPDLFGFASVGVGLPDPTAEGLTWADVRALVGNFMEGEGYICYEADVNGQKLGYLASGGRKFRYPPQCFECHNPTGYTPTGTMYGIADWNQGAPAVDPNGKRLHGVQCEHCHGPAGAMEIPNGTLCRDCHSRTKKDETTGVDSDPNKRIPFVPTADGTTGVFTNHHPQGDEYRRSPHKNLDQGDGYHTGCAVCHSPHKSVWHDQGGVRWGDEEGIGNMCKHCHVRNNPNFPDAPKVRLRGAMGELGLECVECHMPEKTSGSAVSPATEPPTTADPHGHRATHLFRINPTAMAAMDNVTAEVSNPGAPNQKTSYWWNSTDLDGDSFLTLDMVCTNCHSNMNLQQMANYAELIHHGPGLIDLIINGKDTLQVVNRTGQVSVDFSVHAEELAEAGEGTSAPRPLDRRRARGKGPAAGDEGMMAQWWVVCQTPRGWSSWNGKKWRPGLRPWRRNAPVEDTPEQNVLNSNSLKPGYYTYWVAIYPTDGSEHVDSVPLYVTRR